MLVMKAQSPFDVHIKSQLWVFPLFPVLSRQAEVNPGDSLARQPRIISNPLLSVKFSKINKIMSTKPQVGQLFWFLSGFHSIYIYTHIPILKQARTYTCANPHIHIHT